MKKRIVVKVGTNVLTRKNLRLDYNRIYDLTNQIASLNKNSEIILVSSGAVGAGREYCLFKEEKDPLIRKQMLSSLGQGRLYQIYSEFFRENHQLTSLALLTRQNFQSKISFQNIKITLEGLLKNNIIPIINENDVVSNEASTFGDNDQLAALTSVLLNADLLVILTDILGFYTADPKTVPTAKLIPVITNITPEIRSYCQQTLSQGGTGGMFSKLNAAELATQCGIDTVVTSGKQKNSLLKVMKQEIGTLFKGNKNQSHSIENWMNSAAHVNGSIIIASNNIQLDGSKNVLTKHLIDIEGNFQKGDIILIKNQESLRIGVGLANIDYKSLKKHLEEKINDKIVIYHEQFYALFS